MPGPTDGHDRVAHRSYAIAQALALVAEHQDGGALEREADRARSRVPVRAHDRHAPLAKPRERVGEIGRAREKEVLHAPFGHAHGRGRELGVRRLSAEERALQTEERGAPEDGPHVVRVAHAIERDRGAARPRERVRKLARRSPPAWTGQDAEAFVMRRPRESVELTLGRLGARDAPTGSPPRQVRDFSPHGRCVGDTQISSGRREKAASPARRPCTSSEGSCAGACPCPARSG